MRYRTRLRRDRDRQRKRRLKLKSLKAEQQFSPHQRNDNGEQSGDGFIRRVDDTRQSIEEKSSVSTSVSSPKETVKRLKIVVSMNTKETSKTFYARSNRKELQSSSLEPKLVGSQTSYKSLIEKSGKKAYNPPSCDHTISNVKREVFFPSGSDVNLVEVLNPSECTGECNRKNVQITDTTQKDAPKDDKKKSCQSITKPPPANRIDKRSVDATTSTTIKKNLYHKILDTMTTPAVKVEVIDSDEDNPLVHFKKRQCEELKAVPFQLLDADILKSTMSKPSFYPELTVAFEDVLKLKLFRMLYILEDVCKNIREFGDMDKWDWGSITREGNRGGHLTRKLRCFDIQKRTSAILCWIVKKYPSVVKVWKPEHTGEKAVTPVAVIENVQDEDSSEGSSNTSNERFFHNGKEVDLLDVLNPSEGAGQTSKKTTEREKISIHRFIEKKTGRKSKDKNATSERTEAAVTNPPRIKQEPTVKIELATSVPNAPRIKQEPSSTFATEQGSSMYVGKDTILAGDVKIDVPVNADMSADGDVADDIGVGVGADLEVDVAEDVDEDLTEKVEVVPNPPKIKQETSQTLTDVHACSLYVDKDTILAGDVKVDVADNMEMNVEIDVPVNVTISRNVDMDVGEDVDMSADYADDIADDLGVGVAADLEVDVAEDDEYMEEEEEESEDEEAVEDFPEEMEKDEDKHEDEDNQEDEDHQGWSAFTSLIAKSSAFSNQASTSLDLPADDDSNAGSSKSNENSDSTYSPGQSDVESYSEDDDDDDKGKNKEDNYEIDEDHSSQEGEIEEEEEEVEEEEEEEEEEVTKEQSPNKTKKKTTPIIQTAFTRQPGSHNTLSGKYQKYINKGNVTVDQPYTGHDYITIAQMSQTEKCLLEMDVDKHMNSFKSLTSTVEEKQQKMAIWSGIAEKLNLYCKKNRNPEQLASVWSKRFFFDHIKTKNCCLVTDNEKSVQHVKRTPHAQEKKTPPNKAKAHIQVQKTAQPPTFTKGMQQVFDKQIQENISAFQGSSYRPHLRDKTLEETWQKIQTEVNKANPGRPLTVDELKRKFTASLQTCSTPFAKRKHLINYDGVSGGRRGRPSKPDVLVPWPLPEKSKSKGGSTQTYQLEPEEWNADQLVLQPCFATPVPGVVIPHPYQKIITFQLQDPVSSKQFEINLPRCCVRLRLIDHHQPEEMKKMPSIGGAASFTSSQLSNISAFICKRLAKLELTQPSVITINMVYADWNYLKRLVNQESEEYSQSMWVIKRKVYDTIQLIDRLLPSRIQGKPLGNKRLFPDTEIPETPRKRICVSYKADLLKEGMEIGDWVQAENDFKLCDSTIVDVNKQYQMVKVFFHVSSTTKWFLSKSELSRRKRCYVQLPRLHTK